MLLAHYRHRLPADYDLARIRERIAARGPTWDEAPGLIFKAFTLGDRREGAATTAYSSLYLWHDAAAAADFLAGPGFESVVATFGRPRIETWLPLAVDLGEAVTASALVRTDRLLPEGSDLGAERRAEIGSSRRRAAASGVLATVVGLDPAGWHTTRFTLGAPAPLQDGDTACGTIVHLAGPGLAALRAGRP